MWYFKLASGCTDPALFMNQTFTQNSTDISGILLPVKGIKKKIFQKAKICPSDSEPVSRRYPSIPSHPSEQERH